MTSDKHEETIMEIMMETGRRDVDGITMSLTQSHLHQQIHACNINNNNNDNNNNNNNNIKENVYVAVIMAQPLQDGSQFISKI